MKVLGGASKSDSRSTVMLARHSSAEPVELASVAVSQGADTPGGRAEGSFGRLARLAAMVLDTPLACVLVPGDRRPGGSNQTGSPDVAGEQGPAEQARRQRVIDSGDKLIIDDARLDPRTSSAWQTGPANVIAWAGFPVRDPAGRVVGVLCVADRLARHWTTGDVELLESLANVASGEVALQSALEYGAERAVLAQILQESLLPPRLPKIPGLQIAARYLAGGTGVEVLGDFYDVFPSLPGSWGVVVGDVCGKGVPAAKSTAFARYTLRAEAHRQARPSRMLAALNRALLDWLTDDPRFLTAIYATVRPTIAGAWLRVSSAGHPLALVRRADGHVQTFGRPGTLLGVLPVPELHDSRTLLRDGDSLILFTDGVTEARGNCGRDFYGDDRLRHLVAGLAEMPAARMADELQQAVQAFSGGVISDDTVALVLKVP
jgi:serine phosphatase RsbU (regulator of sigma subunit)